MSNRRERYLDEARFSAKVARFEGILGGVLLVAAPVGALVEWSPIPLLLWASAWIMFWGSGIALLHKDRYESLAAAEEAVGNPPPQRDAGRNR